jgi:hypothetical protein
MLGMKNKIMKFKIHNFFCFWRHIPKKKMKRKKYKEVNIYLIVKGLKKGKNN